MFDFITITQVQDKYQLKVKKFQVPQDLHKQEQIEGFKTKMHQYYELIKNELHAIKAQSASLDVDDDQFSFLNQILKIQQDMQDSINSLKENQELFEKKVVEIESDQNTLDEYLIKLKNDYDAELASIKQVTEKTNADVEKNQKQFLEHNAKSITDLDAVNKIILEIKYIQEVLKKEITEVKAATEQIDINHMINQKTQDATSLALFGNCLLSGQLGFPQNWKEAFKCFKKSSELGNPLGYHGLGICNELGKGVDKNPKEAVKYYKLSADEGNSFGQYNLGWCFYYGSGIQQNYEEAYKLFKQSAHQGNSWSQNILGVCYHNGQGTQKDLQKSIKWYQQAAIQGNSIAQYNLGMCYLEGDGIKKDILEAQKWLKMSADQGDELSKKELKKIRITQI